VHFGGYAQAVDVFRSLELPGQSSDRFLAAWAAQRIGDLEQALDWLRPLVRAMKDQSVWEQSTDPWRLALECASALGSDEECASLFRAMKPLYDDKPDDASRRAVLAQCAEMAARSLARLGSRAEARAARKMARELAPAATRDLPLFRARKRQEVAFTAERRGKLERALAAYVEAVEILPSPDVCGNIANLLVSRKDHARAQAWFDLGLVLLADVEPPVRRGWFLAKVAWGLFSRGDDEGAALVAERAAALAPTADVLHTWAAACLRIGDPARARAIVTRALRERASNVHDVAELVKLVDACGHFGSR
jgi:tetratricopeptide (TPR) repeat protein